MRRHTAVAVLIGLTLSASCNETEPSGDDTWAHEAEDVVALLADAYEVGDPYETGRFYTAGGTLDMSIWDLGIATTPDEVVGMVRKLWFAQPQRALVSADHLFVSPDGAVVWWSAYDGMGGNDWIQTYFFGRSGQTASMAFGHGVGTADDRILAERYVKAWETGNLAELEALYSPTVVVLNQTTGEQWRSADELLATVSGGPPVQHGPSPGSFFYPVGKDLQAIVLLQLGGDCPMLEARRLVFSGNSIVKETRFTHVPSAQRCLRDLADGWWTTFVLPPELQDNVTEVVDVGGSAVQLVNAEPIHEEFTRWLFDRYLEAGIGLPEIAAVWFPPAPECDERGGLAIESDERFGGRRTVVICFAEDRLKYDNSDSGWFPTAAGYGLHELAHIWMVDHLTDDVRDAFNDMAEVTVWRGPEARWADRGVERAAFTIPWGITTRADVKWPAITLGEVPCEELADRYKLLTGHDPLTGCDEAEQ